MSMARIGTVLDPNKTGREAQTLEAGLRGRVVGQDEAIEQIVNIYQMQLTGLTAPTRPVGNFLFLGPTGSGKTRIVEAVAETLVGSAGAVIKVDCAEFQHSHEIAKLIGSPPGYLGHRETQPLLSQDNLDRHLTDDVHISFVLFDEIEKASDALWNLLLGILDKATLTLGDNRRVDFSRAMIFMTSNLGASQMEALIRPKLGFAVDGLEAEPDKIAEAGVEAARRKFTPEFMNRIDKVVVFKPLGFDELRRILDIELKAVQQRIFSDCSTPFGFTLSDGARLRLLTEGTDPRYGARHLKRAIERLVVQPLSNLVASRQVVAGDWVAVDYDPDASRFTFLKEAEGAPTGTIAALSVNKLATAVARTVGMPAYSQRPRAGEVNFGE
jgi:ATP-dependent Clp protease ATP-binding subunit ClpA